MNKIINYTLVAMILNWNVSAFAESEEGCTWETVEETATYIQEKCGDNQHENQIQTTRGHGHNSC